MIVGIGTDLVKIERIERALEAPGFAHRYFTAGELAHAQAKAQPAQTLAACFAAKEAFAKALGTGFSGFFPGDVEVFWAGGRPGLRPLGPARICVEQAGVRACHLSLSHDGGMALAFVVLEK